MNALAWFPLLMMAIGLLGLLWFALYTPRLLCLTRAEDELAREWRERQRLGETLGAFAGTARELGEALSEAAESLVALNGFLWKFGRDLEAAGLDLGGE